MWWIAIKELRNLLYDIKFILTFIVAATLILISIANGYIVYSGEKAAAEEVESGSLARMSSESSYQGIVAETVRRHTSCRCSISVSAVCWAGVAGCGAAEPAR